MVRCDQRLGRRLASRVGVLFIAAGALAPLPAAQASLPSASADEDPAADQCMGPLRYQGYFSGLPVAEMTMALQCGGDTYAATMDVAARGVLGWAVEWLGHVETAGVVTDEYALRPHTFQRSYSSGDKKGLTEVHFDPATGIAKGFEDGEPRDDLSTNMRRGVTDPLAALMSLRERIRDGKGGMAYLPVYDGKRRLDVDATIGTAQVKKVFGKTVTAIPVDAVLKPLAGFNSKQEEGWKATTLHVLFSADGQAVPIQIMVRSPLGAAVMNLDCKSGPGCPF